MKIFGKDKLGETDKRIIRIVTILMLIATALALIVVNSSAVGNFIGTVGLAVSPFIYGIVIAYMLNVIMMIFERGLFRPLNKKLADGKIWNKIRRPISLVLSLVILAVLILFILLFMIPELIGSIENFINTVSETLPENISNFTQWVTEFTTKHNIPLNLDFLSNLNFDALMNSFLSNIQSFLESIIGVTVNVVSGVATLVTAFIFSLYLLISKESYIRGLNSSAYAFLPKKRSDRLRAYGMIANRTFYSFIRGQLLECLIIGILTYIGMLIFRFDYALLIASIVGISAIVPILGAFFGAAVGAFIQLLIDPISAFWFLVFIIVLQQLESNIIYPRVVGTSVGLPPIWTLFAVTFWGLIFGIPGVLIGVPSTAVIYKIYTYSVEKRLAKRGLTETGEEISTVDDEDLTIDNEEEKEETPPE